MTLVERFWAKVDRRGTDECWPWTACTDKKGYGKIREDAPSRKSLRAHRVSYELRHGLLAANLEVQHSCNNPPCVNPAHLSQDTPLVNARYRNEQDRQARRENHGRAKLTENQIAEIRRNYIRYSHTRGGLALAGKYGVSQKQIGRIVNGDQWKH